MKKIYTYIIIFLLSVFIFFPVFLALCLPRALKPQGSVPFLQNDSSSFSVTCLDTKTNTVSSVKLEEHLVGVLAAEMPAAYELEALKAQAVAARSYILSKANTENSDHPTAQICTNPNHCKGWLSEADAKAKWNPEESNQNWQKLQNAVNSTRGEYMIYDDAVVEAFFFASSGGKTENSEDVWSASLPYLRSVESPEDTDALNYRSSAVFTLSEFYSRLQPYFSSALPADTMPTISAPTRTSGGSVAEISIWGKTFKGTEIRSIFGLKSANFTITAADGKITFDVLGYGHGVGMSQLGANTMAKSGEKYTEILEHYYTNIQIVKM